MTHLCNICNKKYITNSGFWKHNTKYHNNIQNNNDKIIPQQSSTIPQNILLNSNNLECKYCKKIFTRIDNVKRHEQKCKIKYDSTESDIIHTPLVDNKINKLQTQSDQKYELKNNQPLKRRHGPLGRDNQIISKNSNNNTINNINFDAQELEKLNENENENVNEKLNENENENVNEKLNENENVNENVNVNVNENVNMNDSVNESVKKRVYFNNKRPEFKNIMIKNLKDRNLQIFDDNEIIVNKKHKKLYELINNHIYNIHTIINNNKNKFDENDLIRFIKFLKLLEDDIKYIINIKNVDNI
jgi:hypothetical protein